MTLQSETERRRARGQDCAALNAATAGVRDARAEEKQEAFDQAVAYVEQVTGKTYPGDLWEWLKDGHVLCEMVNKIKPGIIPKVGRAGMPFREMENIDMYNNACRSLGVTPNNTFRSHSTSGPPSFYLYRSPSFCTSSSHSTSGPPSL